jgi:hypothetical protein
VLARLLLGALLGRLLREPGHVRALRGVGAPSDLGRGQFLAALAGGLNDLTLEAVEEGGATLGGRLAQVVLRLLRQGTKSAPRGLVQNDLPKRA